MSFKPYDAFSSELSKPHPSVLCSSKLLNESSPPRMTASEVLSVVHVPIIPRVSAGQLDAVALAAKAHAGGSAFVLADATGCGKGRTAMASALNHCIASGARLVLYVSVTNVWPDVTRDYDVFKDLFKKLGMNLRHVRDGFMKKGVLFVPYSYLKSSNQKDLLKRCSNSALVLDESHCATKLAGKAASIRAKIAHAMVKKSVSRGSFVLFASATWASNVSCLQVYAEALKLVGNGCPFEDWTELKQQLGGSQSSFGFLELVSAELVSRGRMISRQLSMDGVEYDTIDAPPSADHLSKHERLSALWKRVLALEVAKTPSNRKVVLSAGLRLWKAMGLSSRVQATVEQTRKALEQGCQVVLSLSSTGEASATRGEAVGNGCPFEEAGDDDGGAGAVLSDTLLSVLRSLESTLSAGDAELEVVKELKIDVADAELYPASPLDMLKQEIGPDRISELTGRSTYTEIDHLSGKWKNKPRPRGDDVTTERERFQSGIKDVVVLSQACDTGTSLHADREGSKRRVQILFEFPWSSARALQQLGRTHRAGQVSAPKYILLKTSGAEMRFAATVAGRLKSLGALCSGDRDSNALFECSEDELPADELLGPCAGVAMRQTLSVLEEATDDEGKADHSVAQALWCYSVDHPRQFLNRLMAAPRAAANRVFETYCAKLEAELASRAARGSGLSQPIQTLLLESDKVKELASYTVVVNGADVVLRQFKEDLGLTFEEAQHLRSDLVQRGAKPSDVYFSESNSLVHLRTKTTARVYTAVHGVPTTNTNRDRVPPRASSADTTRLADLWNASHAAGMGMGRFRESYVATLPALHLVAELNTAKPAMARLVHSEGLTIAVQVDSAVVCRYKSALAARKAAMKAKKDKAEAEAAKAEAEAAKAEAEAAEAGPVEELVVEPKVAQREALAVVVETIEEPESTVYGGNELSDSESEVEIGPSTKAPKRAGAHLVGPAKLPKGQLTLNAMFSCN